MLYIIHYIKYRKQNVVFCLRIFLVFIYMIVGVTAFSPLSEMFSLPPGT